MKAEIAGFKALLRDAEDRMKLQIEDLVKKIQHQSKVLVMTHLYDAFFITRLLDCAMPASQVNLLYPCMEYHTKEIAVTKARVQDAENEIVDLKSEASINYQQIRALEMSTQRLADVSPANPPVDVQYEFENFTDERYHYYSVARESAQNAQGPVSDPQLGS